MAEGAVLCASDGSVKGNKGTYGYIVTTSDRRSQIKGYGVIPELFSDPTSQCAEYYGATCVILVLQLLIRRFNIPGPIKSTIYIDNEGVIDDMNIPTRKRGLKSHLTSDTDMSLFIRHLLTDLHIEISWTWIKGHQDLQHSYHELSLEAKLNIDADNLAALGHSLPSIPHDHLQGARISVWRDNIMISDTNMRQTITHIRHSKALMDYQQSKFRWTEETMELIDWQSFSLFTSSKTMHEMTNIVKFIFGWQHVGTQKRYFNSKSKQIKCPLCNMDEDQHHYLTCMDDNWGLTRLETWKLLKKKLTLSNTHPSVISVISTVIHNKCTLPDQWSLDDRDTVDTLLQQGIIQQQQIGWKHFFMGRISKKWTELQRQYFTCSNVLDKTIPYAIERGLQKWRKSFITSLIQFGLDLWNARNQQLHGKTSQENRFIMRQNAIARANELFLDGIESVPLNRQRLFGQFDRRITENTKAIKLWILEVERAQEVRKEEMKILLQNQSRITCYFSSTSSVTHRTRHRDMNNVSYNTSRRDAWAQQDLRRLFLLTKPNVRFRMS